MRNYINIKSYLLAVMLMLTAGHLGAQTPVSVSTSTMTGWTIDNGSTFQINTWSTEGESDGSGMTTPFLQNWVAAPDKLPAGTWSQTVTGLTPHALYEMSALVRAYNEGSDLVPQGVCIYAGTGRSYDISFGNATHFGGNTGRFATLRAVGRTDDAGQLTIGVQLEGDRVNWVAMKDVTLTLCATESNSALYYRVRHLDQLQSGRDYVIFTNDPASRMIDGNKPSVSRTNQYSDQGDFVSANTAASAFTLVGSSPNFSLQGVGTGRYLTWNAAKQLVYTDVRTTWRLVEETDGTFTLYKSLGDTEEAWTGISLYERVALSFPKTYYTAGRYNSNFVSPTVTKSPEDVTVTYTSSNNTVAEVNALTGAITAKNIGTAIITATSTGPAGSVSASYCLAVKQPAYFGAYFNATEIGVGEQISVHTWNNHTSLVYSSSDPSVATVDANGVVRGVSVGTATITVTMVESDQYAEEQYTVSIEVKSNGQQVSPELHIYSEKTTLSVGEEVATSVTQQGNGAVTYISSDPNVATVDADGVVTGVGVGTVTITAHSAATNEYLAGESSLTFTVIKPTPSLTFVASKTAALVGDTIKTYLTNSGDGYVTFASSNTSVATVDEAGYIYAVGAGYVTITALSMESEEYNAASATVSINVTKRVATVTPSFETTTLSVGSSLILKLLTESTGIQHFSTHNPSVAEVNTLTGEIIGMGEGTTQISYWIDGDSKYEAISGGQVTVDVSLKPEPLVTVDPTTASMAIGATRDITVTIPEDYTGVVSAVVIDVDKAIVSHKVFDAENHLYVFTVAALAEGETHVRFSIEATERYIAKTIDVPINILHLHQYTLNVVNAPQYGVSIQIWGVTYGGSTVFNSSRTSIAETDVIVKYLPTYSSDVVVDGKVITVTYQLRQPTPGTFVRLRNYSCGLYATLANDGAALGMSAASDDNIIYFDQDSHLLYYENGQFVTATNRMAAVADAPEANTFTFTQGTGDYAECFSVQSNEGKYLLGSTTGTTTGSSAGSDYAYWYVETLEHLPIHISANGYGYGTLYSPVPLEIPGGLTAYIVTDKVSSYGQSGTSSIEYQLVLTQLLSDIPAGTPVILVGVPGTTYQSTVRYDNTDPVPSGLSNMVGHCATQVTADVRGSGSVYALQAAQGKDKVGFYPWQQTYMKGFKCYFHESVPQGAASYRLVFQEAGDVTSRLDTLSESDLPSAPVYNLFGQKVADSLSAPLPAGTYICGGKRVKVVP